MTPRAAPATAVLLLGYGTPDTLDDVLPYFTHIRGGRTPSPEAVENLKRRYERVGGRTPLLDVTRQTARALEDRLAGAGAYRVFVAMKHWHPFIGDVIPRIAALGIRRVIVIVLAPHYSRMSIGAYQDAVADAARHLPTHLDVAFVEHWGKHPLFIDMIADHVQRGLATFPLQPRGAPIMPLFSAHSLPLRIREWNYPYEEQLQQSCAAVAQRAGLAQWRFTWQSAGHSAEPWLGPDIADCLDILHHEGVRRVLSVPIGFLCDHLEVLYDIDFEAQQRATELGITLRRSTMPNAAPALIATLAAIVHDVERGALGTPLAVA